MMMKSLVEFCISRKIPGFYETVIVYINHNQINRLSNSSGRPHLDGDLSKIVRCATGSSHFRTKEKDHTQLGSVITISRGKRNFRGMTGQQRTAMEKNIRTKVRGRISRKRKRRRCTAACSRHYIGLSGYLHVTL